MFLHLKNLQKNNENIENHIIIKNNNETENENVYKNYSNNVNSGGVTNVSSREDLNKFHTDSENIAVKFSGLAQNCEIEMKDIKTFENIKNPKMTKIKSKIIIKINNIKKIKTSLLMNVFGFFITLSLYKYLFNPFFQNGILG